MALFYSWVYYLLHPLLRTNAELESKETWTRIPTGTISAVPAMIMDRRRDGSPPQEGMEFHGLVDSTYLVNF